MRMKIVMCLTAVLMLLLSVGPVTAADVSSADGSPVVAGDGAPVTSADGAPVGSQTAALGVFMVAVAVLASPVAVLSAPFGWSTWTTAVAWPAVIGAGAAGIQALRE